MNDLRYSDADVRDELYGLWNDLRMEYNEHLALWQRTLHPATPHTQCAICERYEGRLHGIMRAIRRFGGRNRRAS